MLIVKPDKEFRDNLKKQLEEKATDKLVELIAKSIHKHY